MLGSLAGSWQTCSASEEDRHSGGAEHHSSADASDTRLYTSPRFGPTHIWPKEVIFPFADVAVWGKYIKTPKWIVLLSSEDQIWLTRGDVASGFTPSKMHIVELHSLATVSKESQKKRRKYSMTSLGTLTRNPQNVPVLSPILPHQMTSWYLFSQHSTVVNDATCPPTSY